VRRAVEGEALPDLCQDHFNRHRVVTAARDDDVRPAFAWFDELQVHRPDRVHVLLQDLLQRTAAGRDVALDPPHQADVGVGVHEHLHIQPLPHPLVGEQQNAVYYHHVHLRDPHRLRTARVDGVVVHRLLDRLPGRHRIEVFHEEVEIERVGVVPVDAVQLRHGAAGEAAVVRVHLDEGHRRIGQRRRHAAGDRGLPGAGPAGNSDHQRAVRHQSSIVTVTV
jgi:hypothetical protein